MLRLRSFPVRAKSAFTLLELMTCIVVISILLVLIIPVTSTIMAKAGRAACVTNLSSLYTASQSYVQDVGHWPQIPTSNIRSPEYAKAWVDALGKYGIAHQNWICASVQRSLKGPDYTKGPNIRIDYYPTPFDDKPNSPFRFSTHPWFMERADVHGDGQLVIFASGQVKSTRQIIIDSSSQRIDL